MLHISATAHYIKEGVIVIFIVVCFASHGRHFSVNVGLTPQSATLGRKVAFCQGKNLALLPMFWIGQVKSTFTHFLVAPDDVFFDAEMGFKPIVIIVNFFLA